MKILLIIPGMDESCDNAHSYIHMQKIGVDVKVITNRVRSTKGPGLDPPFSKMEGMEIHRLFWNFKEQASPPENKYRQVYDFAKKFNPDIILCSQQKNMHLAKRLKKDIGVPIVLLVEFAYDSKNPFRLIGKKHVFKFNFAGAIAAKIYWIWLCRHSSAIITCYHGDQPNFKNLSAFNTPLFYFAWPAAPTIDPGTIEKIRSRGIYIGALTEHKNIEEFRETLPLIFENTPTKEFFIVGSGIHDDIVKELKQEFPEQIIHIPSLPRKKALELIAGSYFAYTPAVYGGWGFFGDCWSMKTPVVATHNDYSLVNEKDSLVTQANNISEPINVLYDDESLYHNLRDGGYERFSKWHKAEAIGEKYLEILKSVLCK